MSTFQKVDVLMKQKLHEKASRRLDILRKQQFLRQETVKGILLQGMPHRDQGPVSENLVLLFSGI